MSDSSEQKIPTVKAQDPKSTASALLEAAFARDEQTEAQRQATDDGLIHYLGCDRNVKHFGIFFAGDPRGKDRFGGGDWYSVYHSNEEPFWGAIDDIVCQQCYAETGLRVHLRVATASAPDKRSGIFFRIPESWLARFAGKVSRDEVQQWLKSRMKPKEPAHAPSKRPETAASRA